MIVALSLKNFILVESLELAFHKGLTVITGETGAGKSILIDAIDLILGSKASTSVIKPKAEKADIYAIFDIEKLVDAQSWLQSHDLLEGNECIIRRVFTKEGKSRCYINQTPVTLQQVSELSEYLIQICGQHAHHQLLKNSYQRQLLDDYAGEGHRSAQIKLLANQIQNLHGQITLRRSKEQEIAQRKEFLMFQLKEFESVAPKKGEFENLEEEFKRLSQGEAFIQNGEHILSVLNGDSKNSLSVELYRLEKMLEPYLTHHPHLNSVHELLASAYIQIDEASHDLSAYLSSLQIDRDTLSEMENRLAELHTLARKYRVQPELLVEYQQNLYNELMELDPDGDHLQKMEQELDQLKQTYYQEAEILSQKRYQAAEELVRKLEQQLQKLSMASVAFQIALPINQNREITAYGLEEVQFLVRTNLGQNFQPLAKVASGGELSRIGLAIQTVLTQEQKTPLIFDEVDVGIGGRVAGIVGQMLRQLGAQQQVIAITHLPQVAAQGHYHLNVAKKNLKDETTSEISYLYSEERIEEISRMLGGIEITEQTRQHARELLEHV